MPDKRTIDSMLFNYETTNRTDFCYGGMAPIVTTKYQEKPTCYRNRPAPLKDVHALTDWKVPNVPFTLFHKAKDVVRTNPRKPQKPYNRPPDLEREQVQKTRPRLVMTPAEKLDDMPPETRHILVNSMYTTTSSCMSKPAELAAENDDAVTAPLPESPAPAVPIYLAKLKPPYVHPEWRMDSVSWDNRSARAYCEPTKEFWLNRTPNCSACAETAVVEARRKSQRRPR